MISTSKASKKFLTTFELNRINFFHDSSLQFIKIIIFESNGRQNVTFFLFQHVLERLEIVIWSIEGF